MPRRICFVTGTRAEFGLMGSALRAIRAHRGLTLQIVATGMHLDPLHGQSVDAIRGEGWEIDRVMPWPVGRTSVAQATSTGHAMGALACVFGELESDIVLVVGDRVEAFAAAAAGHLCGRVVAHVHGGDRALGQVDDSLRHAITKLAHLHFPATLKSAKRIARLGEDAWRIYCIGSPGIDGIAAAASPRSRIVGLYPTLRTHRYALLILHPTDADEAVEYHRARMLAEATLAAGFERIVVVYPNNDPGSGGIIRAWEELGRDPRVMLEMDIARPDFLGLLRGAAVLVGNSSSGIIEAASFGTPVIDVGDRQAGRERSGNVRNVPFDSARLRTVLRGAWNRGKPKPSKGINVYGGRCAGRRLANFLATTDLSPRIRRKLIAY